MTATSSRPTGDTRTAAITGAYVALYKALTSVRESGKLDAIPIKAGVAAVSVGIVDGETLLDLCYEEDRQAAVDFNVVMTDRAEFVEVQGTAEESAFTRGQLDAMMTLAESGICQLIAIQQGDSEFGPVIPFQRLNSLQPSPPRPLSEGLWLLMGTLSTSLSAKQPRLRA